MKKPIAYFLLIIFVSLFIFVLFRQQVIEPVEKTFIFFDTFVHITLYPEEANLEKDPFPLIRKEFERIQQRFGYGERSLPVLLAEQQKRISLSEEDRYLLKKAMEISEQTDGAFDVTIGALQEVWGFKGEHPHVPRESEIAGALRSVGYEQIKLLDSTVSLENGVIIDLGGISKGYAVDQAVCKLKESGIPAGLVDAGGDLRAFGKKPDGKMWTIAIQHPLKQKTVLGTFDLDSGAVATSGSYERSFAEHGIRYHHIIDPRTGYPADHCISVTILAGDALTADAFATGVFVLGPEKGMELVEKLFGIEAVIVFEKNQKIEVITSRGFRLQ